MGTIQMIGISYSDSIMARLTQQDCIYLVHYFELITAIINRIYTANGSNATVTEYRTFSEVDKKSKELFSNTER